jgi:Site-specific recombinases, DNA invertase Pin homologs
MNKQELRRAVAYVRFSSNMQRDESIDAQIRVIEDFAERNGYVIVDTYEDRAVSGTTDLRPAFQKMMQDSAAKKFDTIIVHKLDRFARSRYDSAHNKYILKKNGITLVSVTENLDGSPESVILESVLEGMAEYYSKNLAREVEKGRRENALKGQHVGGVPPLGYQVDPQTRHLVIEPIEAEAVKLIFKMVLKGESYGAILNELNRNAYKTKRGSSFRRNSIYEILRNEKYTGVYIYNKSAAKSVDGRYNRHASKAEEDIIRVEDALPALITKQEFEQVQQILKKRRHKGGKFRAKECYLLSGKISCGICESAYAGNHRKAYDYHIAYTSYRCTRKNSSIRCKGKEIERSWLEDAILKLLSVRVFNDSLLPEIEKMYHSFLTSRDKEAVGQRAIIEPRIVEVRKQIDNIIMVIATTASTSLSQKLRELEQEEVMLKSRLDEINVNLKEQSLAGPALRTAFHRAKQMLAQGTLENRQALVNRFVKSVIVFPEEIHVKFNIVGGFELAESIQRESK